VNQDEAIAVVEDLMAFCAKHNIEISATPVYDQSMIHIEPRDLGQRWDIEILHVDSDCVYAHAAVDGRGFDINRPC
jgi:hypothetical protein